MRIALRTSGGRGEYEFSGHQGAIGISEVFDKDILLATTPSDVFRTGLVCRKSDGKPRLRRIESSSAHLYLRLADILLLPRPLRELRKTPSGKLQLADRCFSVVSIPFDILRQNAIEITVKPTELLLENSDGNRVKIKIAKRLKLIFDLWDGGLNANSRLATLVRRHATAFANGSLEELAEVTKDLRRVVGPECDPLAELLSEFSLNDRNSIGAAVELSDFETALEEESELTETESLSAEIERWQLIRARGRDAIKFRKNVQFAYYSTCLFTGLKLPATKTWGMPGVDAAHILPWAKFNVNKISNGLCLSKLSHWAFDAGVVRLDFIKDRYRLTIPKNVKYLHSQNIINLGSILSWEGDISETRLPRKLGDRPNPNFLTIYNELIFTES